MNTATKTGLDALKATFKKVVHKAAEEIIGNTIADKIVKPKSLSDKNSRSDEEIIVPSEKRQEILNEKRQVL